jgi:putative phosphoribosyl transferase
MTAVPLSRTFDVLGLDLNGYVAMPPNPTALVLFARGPGGSHDDERDVRVANELNAAQISTVLAEMCRDWFRAHLRPRAKARAR